MTTLNKAALPDPVRALRVESSPQETSLCNGCSYAFRFTEVPRYGDAKLNLTICCTHPALGETAREVYGVTACNAFAAGPFAPASRALEDISKALQTDPLDGMSDEEKAAHLDASLSDLEEEGDGIEKSLDTEAGEDGTDDDSSTEGEE